MQDEVNRVREELNNQGADIDTKYQIQLAVLDSAQDQFNKQMSDAQYQFEQGRLSQEELTKIQQDSQAKLAELSRQYASTVSEIQRAAAIRAADLGLKGQAGVTSAKQKADKAAATQAAILPGISGIMGAFSK